jgi:hypothetical protein
MTHRSKLKDRGPRSPISAISHHATGNLLLTHDAKGGQREGAVGGVGVGGFGRGAGLGLLKRARAKLAGGQ